MEPLFPILIFVSITAVSTFLGGLVAIRYRKALSPIIGFAAGVLIATAFADLLPEIFTLVPPGEASVRWIMLLVVLGFISFHCLEKFTLWHVCGEDHEHFERHQDIGVLGAMGLCLHSFFDGVAIGVAFHSDWQVGVMVSTAVVLHKFSDGLSLVSIMALNRGTRRASLKWLTVNALIPFAGAASTFAFTMSNTVLAMFLAFFCGLFLYIGASDLLPEAHRVHTSRTALVATVGGMAFVFILTLVFRG